MGVQEISGLVPISKQEVTILLEAGYLLTEMKRYDHAREVFNGACALLPKSCAPHLALGKLEFALGRNGKALQEYRKAQRIAPQSSMVLAYVGEALLFLGKTKEALKELKKAIEIEPEGDGVEFAKALLDAYELGVLPPSKVNS